MKKGHKMLKVSDLLNIKTDIVARVEYVPKDIPFNSNSKTDPREVLHIVSREGEIEGRERFSGKPKMVTYRITNCNRAIEWVGLDVLGSNDLSRRYNLTTIDINDENFSADFKLCATCGKQADFRKVLRGWESFQAKCKEEYDEREADEERKRKEAWEAEKKEVALIMEDLKLYLPHTYTPTLWEKNEGIIHIKFNGHTYEIQRHDSGQ
jgi:hypothetical protein